MRVPRKPYTKKIDIRQIIQNILYKKQKLINWINIDEIT